MQENDMAMTTNNWKTPGASDPGRYSWLYCVQHGLGRRLFGGGVGDLGGRCRARAGCRGMWDVEGGGGWASGVDYLPGLEAGEDRSLAPGSEAPDGWVMYLDGAFSRHGVGAGAVLISPTQDKLYYAV